ncbi:hypothetical protein AVEN_178548-1 [Araneus ventricosus]|uniref:Uncharacterized protein n=1 Tax=Araneus ventricosus TaxID=182803 RepID=A0A4Y2HHG2_ARAVE|nr:hypothetical protein AVEN_178548-1 [Araneus ventricosus]
MAPLNLKFLQCHRLKTKFQSYASFHIEVYENDFQQLLDSMFWPEACLAAEFYGKLRNDQISQEVIRGSDSNHSSCLDLSTNTDSKRLSLLYQNFRGLLTKIAEFYSSVASAEYDVLLKHGFVKIWIPGTYSTIDILFTERTVVPQLIAVDEVVVFLWLSKNVFLHVNWMFLDWILKLSGFQSS